MSYPGLGCSLYSFLTRQYRALPIDHATLSAANLEYRVSAVVRTFLTSTRPTSFQVYHSTCFP